MKFLCGNCKAKYQIADEKIAGRTLRMKCRRCSHDIVIRGELDEEPPSDAGSRQGSRRFATGPLTGTARRPNPLGSEFRRQVAGSLPPDLPKPEPTELWHVAINDVPVGPIRREEVARKIGLGAVDGESLVWREGFDDWRPLNDVPELAALLKQRKVPAPPGRTSPNLGRRTTTTGSTRGPRPTTGRPPTGRTTSPGMSRRPEPARPPRSNVVPIGGRLGAAAAPVVEDLELDEISDSGEGEVPGAPTQVSAPAFVPPSGGVPVAPPPAPAAAASPAAPSRESVVQPLVVQRRIPVGGWIAIACAGGFGIALALLVTQRYLSEPQAAAAVQPVTTAPEPTAPAAPATPLELPEELAADAAVAAEEEEAPVRRGARGATKQTKRESSLSEEEQRRLALAARGLDRDLSIGMRSDDDRSSSGGGQELNAQQLSSVVQRNRPVLQRCYEQAIRGASNAPSLRLDVRLTVGGSGRVTNVTVSGRSVGTLSDCIERSVRRWVFPSSGGSTTTTFPLVLTPAS